MVTYTLAFSNTGAPLHDVTVTDCVPAGLVPVPGSAVTTSASPSPVISGVIGAAGSCTAGGTPITWTFPGTYGLTSTAGLTARYQVTVVGAGQTLGAGRGVTNTVTLRGDTYPGTPSVVGTTTGDTVLTRTAARTVTMRDASITKVASPTTRAPGQPAAYTVTVTLPRGLRAYDMTVVDTLPALAALSSLPVPTASTVGCTNFGTGSVAPHQVTAAANQIAFFLGDIAATTSTADCVVTLRYSAHPTAAAVRGNVLTNTAALRWNHTDKAIGDQSAVPTPPVWDRSVSAAASVTVIEPALTIAKTTNDPDGSVDPGQVVTYTITLRNSGNAPAFGIRVVDDLPPGMQAPTAISNGGVASPAVGVTPARITWDLFTSTTGLAPGATIALTYSQRVSSAGALGAAGTLVNVADITRFFASADPSTPGHKTYDGPATSRTLNTRVPALAIAKTVADGGELGRADVGWPFTWRIVVSNTGNGTARGVDVVDQLPPNWTYDATTSITTAGPAGCTPSGAAPAVSGSPGQTVTWTDICDLPAGSSLTLTFTARPSTAAVPVPFVPGVLHTNRATAGGSDIGGDALPTVSDTAQATLRVADLRVVKGDGGGTFVVGTVGHYTIDVTNLGPDSEAGPVSITDHLPAGLVLAATPSSPAGVGLGWTCLGAPGDTSFTCTLDAIPPTGLAPGAAVRTIDVPVRVLESALPGGASSGVTLTNMASVFGVTYDKDPSNNDEAEDTPVVRIADHSVNKTLVSGTPAGGADLTYGFTVTNIGPSPSTGTVTLTDPMPAGMRLMMVVAGAGWDCSASVIGTGYTLAANGNLSCTRTTNLDAAGTVFPAVQVVTRIDPAATSAGTITNVGTITAPNDPNLANDSSAVTTAVTPSANLTIAKSDAGATFDVGQTASYTILVSNAGPTNELGP